MKARAYALPTPTPTSTPPPCCPHLCCACTALPTAALAASSCRLLDQVQVEVGEGWMQQMRLVTAEPGRAARLLMAGAAAARSAAAAAPELAGAGEDEAAAVPASAR